MGLSVVLFSLSAPLAKEGGLWARYLLVPTVSFLLPAILWASVRGRLLETFPGTRPGCRALGVAAALVVGGSLVSLSLAGLLTEVFGGRGDEEAVRALLFSVGPGWRLLYFALAPALCEEALFRGAFLRALRPWGPGAASVCSALAFAAIHASWMKFLPVAILGWVLAQVVIKTGNLWLAVAGHALHNGIVLWVLGWEGATAQILGPSACGLAVLVLVMGLGVAMATRPRGAFQRPAQGSGPKPEPFHP